MIGQWCSIFENKYIGNCSNGGVSATEKQVFVVGLPEEELRYPKESEGIAPELIMEVNYGHRGYKSLRPVHKPAGVVGPMAGGSIVMIEFKVQREYLPLHDRFETQELHDKLSR